MPKPDTNLARCAGVAHTGHAASRRIGADLRGYQAPAHRLINANWPFTAFIRQERFSSLSAVQHRLRFCGRRDQLAVRGGEVAHGNNEVELIGRSVRVVIVG